MQHTCIACFSLVTSYTCTLLVFHWSRLGLKQYLFSIGHILHPYIACFPVIALSILSMAECIGQQHPPGSSQDKVIYYTNVNKMCTNKIKILKDASQC